MDGLLRRIRQDWVIVTELALLGAFTAADASGLLEQLTGWHVEDSWVFLAAILIIGVTSMIRLDGLRDEIDEMKSSIRVTATLNSLSMFSSNDPEERRLRADVSWEVWVDRDIATDQLALNLIYEYDRPWWSLGRTRRVPTRGLVSEGQETTEYRKQILASDAQPFEDNATFKYRPPSDEEAADARWLMELVLLTGVPKDEYRVPVFVDHEALRTRGTLPPL